MFNGNVKFKQCVINDVSYGCRLLALSVSTKGFKRYSTGLKRVREVLENTFNEYSADMLLTELYRAENNSFDGGCVSVRSGHSYLGGASCKYVVDFYYSPAEHFKDDIYVKSMTCVFSVYLRGNTVLSDILLSDGLLSSLFAEDTTSDTSDTTSDTKDTTDTITICLGSLDDIQIEENKPFLPVPLWFYQRANIYIWSAILSAYNCWYYCDRRKRVIVKPVRISPHGYYPVRISPYGMSPDFYPYKMLVDGFEMWDCRSRSYNEYLSDLIGAPPYDLLPF